MDHTDKFITRLITENKPKQLADIFRVIEHKKGFTYGPHSHEDIEINYVKRGTCTMRFDTGLVRFYEDDCMILYPNAEHYFEVDRTKCILVQIQFNLSNFPELTPQPEIEQKIHFLHDVLTNKRNFIKISDKKNIRFSIERIILEQQERKDNYETLARLYFGELFILLSREIKDLLKSNQIIHNDHLGKALDFINSKYFDDVDMQMVADETGVSPRYLRKLFSEYLGISPVDYITSLRIAKAKELMKDPAQSLKEIGYAAGFGNQQYFSKRFKLETGFSPNDYRNNMFRLG
jgi:AraC-like DNA-binding protein